MMWKPMEWFPPPSEERVPSDLESFCIKLNITSVST